MSYYNTTITPTTTGNFDINTDPLAPFTPTRFRITVSARNSGSGDNINHMSQSHGDASWQAGHFTFSDTSGGRTKRSAGTTATVVCAQERVSGTITDVNVASFVQFTSTGLRVNISTLSQLYQYNVELFA